MFGMDPYVLPGPATVQPDEPHFPTRLHDLAVPPSPLWVRGRLPAADGRLVAIVGSRAATRAAAEKIFAMAVELAEAGWGVISGGALGIDAAAHRGALRGKGATFVVLGCGIDVVYPDRHRRLFDEVISGGGGLLSEYSPGTPPRPGQFPARNRIVAALARIVIVGESRAGSGALITARLAATLGRPLLAIPGSAGTDGLLATGAALPAQSAADVMDAAGLGDPNMAAIQAPMHGAARMPRQFVPLLRALTEAGALAPAVLARQLGLSLAETLAVLSEAELAGVVVRAAGAKFEARFKGKFEAARGH